MTSYRIRLAPGAVRAGVDPADVLPAAMAAARGLLEVEAGDVAVVAGRAWIVVRVNAPDDGAAAGALWEALRAVEALADVHAIALLRRERGRWIPLDPAST